jgi:hypothetical protein
MTPGKKCSPRAMNGSADALKCNPNFLRSVLSIRSHVHSITCSSVISTDNSFRRRVQRLNCLMSGTLSGSSRVCCAGAKVNGPETDLLTVCAVNKYRMSVTEHVEAMILERISAKRNVHVGVEFQSRASVKPARRAKGVRNLMTSALRWEIRQRYRAFVYCSIWAKKSSIASVWASVAVEDQRPKN